MSFAVFKDFDKSSADVLNDDFGTKYVLKIKSPAPANTTITTTTTVVDGKFAPVVAAKWVNQNFTLEKLELTPDQNAKVTVETSLVGVAPGLKLEFKGNDVNKADILFTYSAPVATVTGDIDFFGFSSAKFSVAGGHGPFTAGVSSDLKIAKYSVEKANFGLGFGYTVPKTFFIGIRAIDNFSKYSARLSYLGLKDITLAGLVEYSDKPSVTLGGSYKCNPATSLKLKATSAGVLSASVKQVIEKKLSVVGSAEIPKSFSGIKFGINATLG
eukprot:gene11023-14804_t